MLLIASNIVLWLVVLVLALTVFALARQIGVLHERLSPVGALSLPSGLKAGEKLPVIEATALDGSIVRVGEATVRGRLLFFLSPTCPVCKKLLPIVRALAAQERDTLDVLLAGDGEADEYRRMLERERASQMTLLNSSELGQRLQIGKLPYAVLLDRDGKLVSQGLVNNREQLESLLTARDIGVATVQEFIARTAHSDHSARG